MARSKVMYAAWMHRLFHTTCPTHVLDSLSSRPIESSEGGGSSVDGVTGTLLRSSDSRPGTSELVCFVPKESCLFVVVRPKTPARPQHYLTYTGPGPRARHNPVTTPVNDRPASCSYSSLLPFYAAPSRKTCMPKCQSLQATHGCLFAFRCSWCRIIDLLFFFVPVCRD